MPQKLLELCVKLFLKTFDRFLALLDHEVLLLKLVVNVDLLLSHQPFEVSCLLNLLILPLPMLLFQLFDRLIEHSDLLLKLLKEHGDCLNFLNVFLNFTEGCLTYNFDFPAATDHESVLLVLFSRLSFV